MNLSRDRGGRQDRGRRPDPGIHVKSFVILKA